MNNSKRNKFIGLFALASALLLQVGLARNIVHTHTGDGWLNQVFDVGTPETLIMEGKAPANGHLLVRLEALGNTIVHDFELDNGACRSDNIGQIGVWQYDFVSRVTLCQSAAVAAVKEAKNNGAVATPPQL